MKNLTHKTMTTPNNIESMEERIDNNFLFEELRKNGKLYGNVINFIHSEISLALETQRREMVEILMKEKVFEAIMPGQSHERLQMKRQINRKINKILALLQNNLTK